MIFDNWQLVLIALARPICYVIRNTSVGSIKNNLNFKETIYNIYTCKRQQMQKITR